ncbi:MAG: hypothetical protein JNN02_09220 [Tabrizicola sp.]|nr:hypothetical protein [Tabrizicola sp.]
MNPLRFLLKAKQLARHPPAAWKVRLFAGVVGVCLLLIGIEVFIGWPDWLRLDSGRLIR